MNYPENDCQYEDKVLSEVRNEGTCWALGSDSEFLSVEKKSDIKPEAGDTVRFYGKGTGYPVRGVFINGRELYYRTKEQEEQRHREWVAKQRREKEADFIAKKEERDKRISELPEVLQKRFAGFYERNPDFRIEFEPYELFGCEQAVLIINVLKTREEIIKFKDLDYKEQVRAVPGLSEDHSGNTFACALAIVLVSDEPENAINFHGALCPLVGCKEYGCWAVTQKKDHSCPKCETRE